MTIQTSLLSIFFVIQYNPSVTHQVTHLLHEASPSSMTLHLHQNPAHGENRKWSKEHSDQGGLRNNPSTLFKEMTGLNLNCDKNYPTVRFLVVISSPSGEVLG